MKSRKKALGSMIAEATTYMTKGPSEKGLNGRESEFTHPLLVVLMEIAMRNKPHYWAYGTLVSAVQEARITSGESRRREGCPVCGGPLTYSLEEPMWPAPRGPPGVPSVLGGDADV